jgi:predicted nucleic acid-binding protein
VLGQSSVRRLDYYNSPIGIIHFNEITSKLAIEFMEQFHLSHGLLIPDAVIAATAVTFNLKLFTYNLKDFRFIPGIKIYEY